MSAAISLVAWLSFYFCSGLYLSGFSFVCLCGNFLRLSHVRDSHLEQGINDFSSTFKCVLSS